MCGICVLVVHTNVLYRTADQKDIVPYLPVLDHRGPDIAGFVSFTRNSFHFDFIGHVLHLRGCHAKPTKQPVVDEKTKNVLLWNGEVFGGIHVAVEKNDTDVMFEELIQSDDLNYIAGVFEKVQGPFSFLYWVDSRQELFFGKDQIGRRSLVVKGLDSVCLQACVNHCVNENADVLELKVDFQELSISSAPLDCLEPSKSFTDWIELPPIGIFSCLFDSTEKPLLRFIPWSSFIFPPSQPELSNLFAVNVNDNVHEEVESKIDETSLKLTNLSKFSSCLPLSWTQDLVVDAFLNTLTASIFQRICSIPRANEFEEARVAVLFSGGVDSVLLAYLASRALESVRVSSNEIIDLVNVSVGPSLINIIPEYDAMHDPLFEQQNELISKLKPGDLLKWKSWFFSPDRLASFNAIHELKMVLPEQKWRLIEVDVTIDELEANFEKVLRLICPLHTIMDFNIGSVLWFGGRAKGWVFLNDHEIVVSVDLRYGPSPSEIIGKVDLKELQRESSKKRSAHLKDQEKNRAANLHQSKNAPEVEISGGKPETMEASFELHQSCAKVFLVGLGADEQLAGYGRHRTVYHAAKQKGEDIAANRCKLELAKDTCRLWKRNLARDDRVISDSGRESRHPYLDENVIKFLISCPFAFICDLNEPAGMGDKKLLRLAAEKLGLKQVCRLEKRALQFGTRIANKDVSGTIEIGPQTNVRNIVHQRSLFPEVIHAGGRTKIPSDLSKITLKQKRLQV